MKTAMAKILPFKRPTPQQKNDSKTLCHNDFHKWRVVTKKRFDVKQGRLVTVLCCTRYSKEKTRLL